jgi:hypothetical protein
MAESLGNLSKLVNIWLSKVPETGNSTYEVTMRLLCAIQGHRFVTIREEWLKPEDGKGFTSLLRFDECSHCHDVRATITNPEDHRSRWSIANRTDHRTIGDDDRNLATT